MTIALGLVAPSGHGDIDLVFDLATILCVAAVTTVLFQRFRQPVVLGYLLAGLIVGPHLPIPLFADERVARDLSEVGVILVMFSLGIEFSLGKLVKVAPTAGIVAIIECSLQMWLGYAVGRAFGWTAYESLFLGAMIAISSTTIIVKAFAEQRVGGLLGELVFGILIVEDLIAILLLAVLTAVASGVGLSATALGFTMLKLGGFLVGVLTLGMLLIPRTVRAVVRRGSNETTTIVSIGICFACALLARAFGYSVALGAFLAGALVSESGQSKAIEGLLEPVRDVFAAIFFVSVGMLIDPKVIAENWLAVVVLSLVVSVGKVIGVTSGAFLTGNGVAVSVRTGMSFAQIGEFSFIIAALGLSLGVTRSFLYPVAVAVSAVTAFTTPWLIRAAGPAATYLDRRLPRALQTYVALYGAWVARLRHVRDAHSIWSRIRKLSLLLLADVAGIAGVIIGTSLVRPTVGRWLGGLGWTVTPLLTSSALIGAALVLAAPFALGAIRVSRALGAVLANEALPIGEAVDLSAAPRRALVVTTQIGILLVVGIPLMALTQPFVPSVPGPALLMVTLTALVFPLWRSTTNLNEHVRAGAQVVLERLAAEGQPQGQTTPADHGVVDRILAGMGAATGVRLLEGAPAVGRTLKQLQLRGRSSATVVAIDRGGGIIHPTGDEILVAGDLLVLTGSQEAVEIAQALLRGATSGGGRSAP